MADVKNKAHELAVSLAAMSSMEAQVRKMAQSRGESVNPHDMIAMPVATLQAVSRVADKALELLTETGLIDPLRVKEETSKKKEEAERDQIARQAIMQQLRGALGAIFGVPSNPEEMREMMQAAAEGEEGCGDPDCPGCTLRKAILSGELDQTGLDVPASVRQMMTDYGDAVKSPAAIDIASMMPSDPRIKH